MISLFYTQQGDALKTFEHSPCSSLSEHTAQLQRNCFLIYVDLILKPRCEADFMFYSQQRPCVVRARVSMCSVLKMCLVLRCIRLVTGTVDY